MKTKQIPSAQAKGGNAAAAPPLLNSPLAYLDKEAAARMLGIGVRTLDVWMSKRLIPWLKIGRTVRFSAADIDSYLQARCRIAAR